MPVIIVRASDMGKTGYETYTELNADKDFFARLEKIRIAAGTAMGIADVADKGDPEADHDCAGQGWRNAHRALLHAA